MNWKKLCCWLAGIAVLALLVESVRVSHSASRKAESVEATVAELLKQQAIAPAPVTAPAPNEAMSVVMTDEGDLRITVRVEGKNDDPKRLDWAVLDAVHARIREAMPKERESKAAPATDQSTAPKPLTTQETPKPEKNDEQGWTPVPQRTKPARQYSGQWQTLPRPRQPQPQPRRPVERHFHYFSW